MASSSLVLWVAYNSFPYHRSEHSISLLKIPCSVRDLSSVLSPERLKQLVNSWGKMFPPSDRMSAGQCRSFNVTGGYYAMVHACQSDDVRCRCVVCDLSRSKHCDRLERGGSPGGAVEHGPAQRTADGGAGAGNRTHLHVRRVGRPRRYRRRH